jgi:hypothetical protein
MPPKPIVQRIAELEARKQALQARLGKQERARDTRRRVVLGSFILHQLEFKQTVNKARHYGSGCAATSLAS